MKMVKTAHYLFVLISERKEVKLISFFSQ